VTLSVSDQDAAQAAVRAGNADFAVVIGEAIPDSEWLSEETLGHEELIAVCAPGTERTAPLSTDELAQILTVRSPETGQIAVADRPPDPNRSQLRTIELGHPEVIKRAVEHGLGAAVLFRRSVERELHLGTLVELEVEGGRSAHPVRLVKRRDTTFSEAQIALIAAIRDSCAGGVPREDVAVASTRVTQMSRDQNRI
jgi:DNA-binding transcriptional LysR family regulator